MIMSEKEMDEQIEAYKLMSIEEVAHNAYNRAIDDLVKFASDMPTIESEDGEIRPMWLEEMAEQLKKKLTCLDCRHHFMSDCYLECYKNNRINNNKVCDEFEQLKEKNNENI